MTIESLESFLIMYSAKQDHVRVHSKKLPLLVHFLPKRVTVSCGSTGYLPLQPREIV